jgi:hypothetical protein
MDSTRYAMGQYSQRYIWSTARQHGRVALMRHRLRCISVFENQAPRLSQFSDRSALRTARYDDMLKENMDSLNQIHTRTGQQGFP